MKQIPCEIYTRIVGYYRPVSEANKGKREEISQRKLYKLPQLSENPTHADDQITV